MNLPDLVELRGIAKGLNLSGCGSRYEWNVSVKGFLIKNNDVTSNISVPVEVYTQSNRSFNSHREFVTECTKR